MPEGGIVELVHSKFTVSIPGRAGGHGGSYPWVGALWPDKEAVASVLAK